MKGEKVLISLNSDEIDLSCAIITKDGSNYYAYYPKFINKAISGNNFVQLVCSEELEEVDITKYIQEK